MVKAGETRASNDVTVRLEMNKMFPNATADFKGIQLKVCDIPKMGKLISLA